MNQSSIITGVFQQAYDQREWIYKNECELLFISEGTGKRIVGDRIDQFKPGDLIFIGSKLPHIWVSDPIKLDPGSDRCVESIFIRFNQDFLMGQLMLLPEFKYVREAIHKSSFGCEIIGNARNKISELMMQVPYLEGFEQIINLLNILNEIGKSDEINYLTSQKYQTPVSNKHSERIQVIIDYLIKNYQKPMKLELLAETIHIQPASLCRLFKNEMAITISEYLNRLRIDLASKMLMNNHLLIEEVAFECGFNSISFFNRQFKKIKGISPTAFRKSLYETKV